MRRTIVWDNHPFLVRSPLSAPGRGVSGTCGVVLLGLLVALSGSLASCRTSQQEARRNANVHTQLARGQAAVSHEVDSLLLIESKLVEVIDSMTDLVDADHARILALEREVNILRSRRSSALPPSGFAPPLSYGTPSGSSVPPPPGIAPPPTDGTQSASPPFPSRDDRSSNSAGRGATTSAGLQERYAAALRLFNANNFSSALTAFRSIEQDDPSGPLASNYKYWQGECYYAMKQYDQALQTFREVVENYPHTTKAAASEFKMAESYERLDLIPSARTAYQRLLDLYPTSEFSSRARARLAALK